jgi:hypothetical protein
MFLRGSAKSIFLNLTTRRISLIERLKWDDER